MEEHKKLPDIKDVNDIYSVLSDERVGGYARQFFQFGLSNNNTIKRVPVKRC